MPEVLHCQGQIQEQQKHERQAEDGGVAAPQVEFVHRETEKQQNSCDTPDSLAEKLGADQINREKQQPINKHRQRLLQKD